MAEDSMEIESEFNQDHGHGDDFLEIDIDLTPGFVEDEDDMIDDAPALQSPEDHADDFMVDDENLDGAYGVNDELMYEEEDNMEHEAPSHSYITIDEPTFSTLPGDSNFTNEVQDISVEEASNLTPPIAAATTVSTSNIESVHPQANEETSHEVHENLANEESHVESNAEPNEVPNKEPNEESTEELNEESNEESNEALDPNVNDEPLDQTEKDVNDNVLDDGYEDLDHDSQSAVQQEPEPQSSSASEEHHIDDTAHDTLYDNEHFEQDLTNHIFGLQKIVVMYQTGEYNLFDNGSGDNNSYFLDDYSISRKPISALFQGLRDALGQELGPENELCIQFREFGMEIEEDSCSHLKISISELLCLHEKFIGNENPSEYETALEDQPLHIYLAMRPKVTERLQLLLQGADAGKTLTQLLTKEDISGEEIFEGGDDEEVEDEAESRDDVGDQLDFEETNEGIHDSLEYEAGSDNEIHSGGQTLEKFDNDSSTYEKISEAFEEGEDNVDDEIDPNEEFSEIMERPIVNEGLPSAVGSTTGFPDDTEFMTEVITVAGMSNKGETTPGHDKSKDDNSSVAGDKKAPLDDSHSEPPRASTQEKEDDLEDWSENGLETSDTVPNSDAYHDWDDQPAEDEAKKPVEAAETYDPPADEDFADLSAQVYIVKDETTDDGSAHNPTTALKAVDEVHTAGKIDADASVEDEDEIDFDLDEQEDHQEESAAVFVHEQALDDGEVPILWSKSALPKLNTAPPHANLGEDARSSGTLSVTSEHHEGVVNAEASNALHETNTSEAAVDVADDDEITYDDDDCEPALRTPIRSDSHILTSITNGGSGKRSWEDAVDDPTASDNGDAKRVRS